MVGISTFKRGMKANCTQPPRTRPGKEYPGGRPLRRAYKRLARANGTQEHGKSADHGMSKIGGSSWTKPGAMKH